MPIGTWLSIVVTIIGAIMIPILVFSIQGARRAAQNEQKLEDLIAHKDETHQLLARMIDGLDKRIRWVEESIWRKGGGHGSSP